uniref:C2H2-type domain-containing protein n=1 Tax=Glossina morsitans morsitans TaxID=37546 RepID=A0A1B0FAB4_GLOMM
MEKEIDKKFESLRKYIPFVDYVTHMDREKYKKFLDIKSWIINKKRCAISDLMKIEQSFIAQYKNLFLEDLKVPEDIRKIFAGRVDLQYVNLCSDDEKGETNSPQQITKSESDDDLETIELLFPTSSNGEMEKYSEAPRIDLKETLTVIETLDSNNSGKEKLFARRSDISKHAAKQNIMRNKKKSLPLLSVTETISLDSSSSDDDSAPAISSEKISEPKPPKYENVNAAPDRKLLSPQGSTLLNNTRKEHQEDSVVSANIKYGNNKTSENISDAINRLADKNEVNNNRSTSNDRLSQLTGGFESLSMEELTLLFNSLNQGHQLEKFLSRLQKNCQSHEKFENIHGEKAHRTNERLFTDMPTPEAAAGNTGFSTAHLQEDRFFNTHRELTALPPPTKQLNPTAFHQFSIQCIAGGTYPGYVPNDNQSTATTNVHHRPTYALNLSQRADIGISIPGPSYPMQRKLNMNDPRILKHLQRIQNFPFASNTLRDKTTSLRRNIPPFQFPTDQTENAATNWRTNFPPSTHQLVAHNIGQQRTLVNDFMLKRSNPNVSKTYLEHKRRKAEEERKKKDRLNEEMQQRGAKKQDKEAVPAAQQIENKELKNQQDQILSIPHTHLISREGDVQTLWDEYKRNFESTNKVTDQAICDSQSSSGTSSEVSSSLTNKISHFSELAKVNNETTQSPQPVTTIPANEVKQLPSHVTATKANNETRQSSNCATIVKIRNKTKQPSHSRTIADANNDKIHKVHKTLECTINGYNQFENYIPKSLGGKRSSSMHARDIISKQLNDGDSLIDFDTNANSKSKRQRQSEVKRARSLRIEDSSDSDADSLPPRKTSLKYKYIIRKRQPVVKLQHLKEGQCFKNQHPFQDLSKLNQIGIASDEQKKLNVQLIETRSTPVEIDQNTANINKRYRRNNNCQMTELNTRFCVLCAAKPADLTNHYIRKHKTESYVSRLTWAQLDDLIVQTNFAELQGSGNQRSAHFKVTCPFCEDILIQPFMTLYDHYSKHTGEYAYMCTHCSFTKPFRADILSHQRNSKNCRRATLKIMYRYPPNTMAIYLHYCSICNYAQLNKANVLKHLREQHSPREAIESNVINCILAAIQIAPRTQADESCSNLTNTKLRSNEDNIHDGLQENLNSLDQIADKVKEGNAMCNEPCAEETEMVDDIRKLKFFQNQVTQDPVSITENHCPIDAKGSIVGMSVALAGQQPRRPTKHLKCEEMDVFEMDMTPLTQFSESARNPESALTLNESPLIYRSFPANVTYLGLYKCIAEDCYFSTNHADEMLSHLEDHANSECTPVEYIQCAYCVLRLDCSAEFFATYHLQKHMELVHKMTGFNLDLLKSYSCIYCPTSDRDHKSIRIHLAIQHPGEFPFICDHKITEDVKMDFVQSLKLVNLADAVPSHLLRDVSDYKSTDNTFKQREVSQTDIKPDIMVLSEETVKVRLRKLTESTGVSPENLFRCAESTCGGFFSLYELWLSHMKGRHCSLICFCPQCPNTSQDNSDREMLKLTDFEGHFEVHRGHAYICFHCLDTFKYENDLRNHAEIVHQLNEIRLEQIRCNISYAYNVLINSELYTERIMFLSELLKLLEKKLKQLEEIHLNELRHRWLVPNTTDWLENFPSHQCSRELIKKCLQGGCKYLATKDETLYDHIRSQHEIIGHSFLCSQCPFQLANCDSWEPIFEHLKVHSLSHLHICCVCSFHHRCRSSLMGHIRQEHDARDAPFVQITKNGESIFVELAIVFANGELSFSTMRDCFCCEERSMKADVLALHLKHYHKLRLNYYCELCYIRLDGLQNCDEHFNERHLNKKRKIYCTLAHQGNITVTSIQPFQIHVQNLAETLLIKSEPKDDSVIVLEEDDIAIAGDISKKANSEANRPTLRCVSTQNLLKSAAVNSSTNRLFPIRIINGNTIQTNEGPLKPFLIEQSPRDIPEDLQRNFGSYT